MRTYLIIRTTDREILGIQQSPLLPFDLRPGVVALEAAERYFGIGVLKESWMHYRHNTTTGEIVGEASDLVRKVPYTADEVDPNT